MKQLIASALFVVCSVAHAEIKREDYPSYKAYADAITASNAGHIDQMDQKRRSDCEGVPAPTVGETRRTLYCAGAESAGSSCTEYGCSFYYELGSSFYVVELGRITYARHY